MYIHTVTLHKRTITNNVLHLKLLKQLNLIHKKDILNKRFRNRTFSLLYTIPYLLKSILYNPKKLINL